VPALQENALKQAEKGGIAFRSFLRSAAGCNTINK
jgi:hypothetical protein